MVKRLIDADITDRDDGKLPAWSDAGGTHTYVSPLVDPTSTRGDVLVRGAAALGRVALAALGKVLMGDGTDAVAVYPPGHEFDYVQITSNVSVTGNEASPTTCITGNSVTLDGGIVMVEMFSPVVIPQATANASLKAYLFVDGTNMGRLAEVLTPVTTQAERVPMPGKKRIDNLSAGSHQFIVKCSTTSGTATFGAGAGDADATHFMPAFLRVTKV